MDSRPTRERILSALKASNVEFPETASIAQLRTLYDSLQVNGGPSKQTELPSGNVVSSDSAGNSSVTVTTMSSNTLNETPVINSATADPENLLQSFQCNGESTNQTELVLGTAACFSAARTSTDLISRNTLSVAFNNSEIGVSCANLRQTQTSVPPSVISSVPSVYNSSASVPVNTVQRQFPGTSGTAASVSAARTSSVISDLMNTNTLGVAFNNRAIGVSCDVLPQTQTSVPPSVSSCVVSSVPSVNYSSVSVPANLLRGQFSRPSVPSQVTDPFIRSSVLSREADELESEIRVLRLKQEMLALRNQIESLENGGKKVSTNINYDELSMMVPKFSGNDGRNIEKWINSFESYTINMTDQEKYMCLRYLLVGTAREFMENSNYKEYKELKRSLLDIFKRTVTQEEVYQKLRLRKLKPTEPCIAYIVAMQTIAAEGEINEQELVDIIIDGMEDKTNNISILYGSNSLQELMHQIDRYEKRRSKTVSTYKEGRDNTKGIRCFNCSQFGHMKNTCNKPRRPPGSCFHCFQMGHFYKDCPKTMNVTAPIFCSNDIVDTTQMPN
ncbi:uncharacterized protein LOC131994324 [Stomoxys calcitrans]|uniref:uncharacterized protein LOC131994324 n=1 Tax=Stomoxys calcitrans TaxID=35570 RepID=UPI0027E31FB9|nr:uncharacterized protein LOC131994324 [Stomoxys calcitrans]